MATRKNNDEIELNIEDTRKITRVPKTGVPKNGRPKIGSKKNSFWKFLGIYAGVLVVVIAAGLFWLVGLLRDYEASMPDNAMASVMQQFSSDKIEALIASNIDSISEYEKMDNVVSYFETLIAKGELSFARKSGEYTSEKPVYVVKSADRIIAKVSLSEASRNSHDFTEWKTERISLGEYVEAANEITITAPAAAQITINGKTVDDTILAASDVEVEATKNVGDYVTTPKNNVYKISGMIAEPEILATLDGTELAVTESEKKPGEYTIQYPSDEELLEAQKENITAINTAYGKYIINKGSLSKLQSYMVGNAKKYVSDIPAVWAFLYGKTYTYQFENDTISNFVKYSEDCFSCDVHYDLYVEWNNENKTYDTNMKYIFVKKKGKWYLADFNIL